MQNKDPRQRRARLKCSTSYFCLFPLDENELQCKPSSKKVKTSISLPQSSSHFAAILAKSLLRRHVTCTTLIQLPVRVASPVPSCVYVFYCIIHLIPTCADVHSDVSMSVKCSGGVGCSTYYNGTLAQVVSEALQATEGSSVRLQGVYTVMYMYKVGALEVVVAISEEVSHQHS